MASAIEAPASTTAEGQTSHTPNQVGRLTSPQLRMLHRGLDPNRIGKDDKGFAHMQAWDIKRYLLRVFGFAGYDTENRELTLVREIETPNGPRSKWTVVYRAQVRLTVKDVRGRELGHWDGEAAGVGNNLPNLGDSHDMAMKSATSQALKRAATNLGDQFGLSLYNDGSPAQVVGFSAAHPPAEWEKAAEPVPEPNDPPVKPEQGSGEEPPGSVTVDPASFQPHPDGQDFANQAALATSREAVESLKSTAEAQGIVNAGVLAPDSGQPDVLAAYLDRRLAELVQGGTENDPAGAPPTSQRSPSTHLAKLLRQAKDCWMNPMVLAQIKADGEAHEVLDEEFSAKNGTVATLRKVLDDRIAELQQSRAA